MLNETISIPFDRSLRLLGTYSLEQSQNFKIRIWVPGPRSLRPLLLYMRTFGVSSTVQQFNVARHLARGKDKISWFLLNMRELALDNVSAKKKMRFFSIFF